ncbi:ATP synthase subunit b [Nitritalea halalkaliphila LW7]|uniref:ATP synthase subunit b n=1 Tax=Nitritalea halalkaliphila LW7 TaxID=1189621 RepID=I5BZP5_9BACT|nr:F0F1 ATP synthase subunit B [Nitritalea halalkaliphila]EIM75047.1 ATP synthase subunit b [Nitritalea halalkaliphila LW7]
MDLITPSSGLIIWQLLGFLALLLILAKFAWKPILAALEERESTIEQALSAAEAAKAEMANLKSENERLLQEARAERDAILKSANDAATKMLEEAKNQASAQATRMIEDAKAVIETEKKAALTEVKVQVAQLSLDITEKLLRKSLANDTEQKALVDTFVKDLKLN